MAQRRNRRNNKFGIRGFIILVLVTLIGAAALHVNGNLVSPFSFAQIAMNTPPMGEDSGFQMVDLDALSTETTSTDGVSEDLVTETDTAGTEVIDSEAVDFSEPPARGEMGDKPQESYTLADYFDFSWDDIGSVVYNAWMMLALTVAVIVIARPIGWVVKTAKRVTNRQPNRAAA